MSLFAPLLLSSVQEARTPVQLGSLLETLVRGGPVMIPLGLCSLVGVAWMLDRAVRMRAAVLGDRAQAQLLVSAARESGPARALEMARARPTALSNVFEPVFLRWQESRPALEKAVEDSGSRAVRGLITSLRPLTVIAVSAPLLGLLGTVIGIIIAFRDIALSDAMGKPEALAVGIAQALVTTASGLVVAIPAQLSYYWFRAKVDRFWSLVEETGEQIFAAHAGPSSKTVPAASTSPGPALLPDHAPVLVSVTP